jgi:hypothetical protein
MKEKEEPRIKVRASPYNNRIDLSARGCHAGRLRIRRASFPPAAGLSASAYGPCSQVIRPLYGRWESRKLTDDVGQGSF